MRSAQGARQPSPDDLTTRARIRDAAVLRFGRDGFGTPLRTIAADAGVSAGLVIHHFGTKVKLREACDARILDDIKRAKRENLTTDTSGRFLEYLSTTDQYAPIFAYVVRSLQHGGPLAKAFVDHMIEDAVEYVSGGVAAGVIVPSRNERARARYLVLSSLGAGLLSITLDPPENPADLAAMMRHHFDATTLPSLEVFTEGLLTTRRMLDDYLTYVSDPPGTRDEDVAD
jgi:AcrR family transcriptional regulator